MPPRFDGLRPATKRSSDALRRVCSKGSAAEMMLRRALWGRGHRYTLHSRRLPGKPDIVFTRSRVAVFVDGDFWHGRNWKDRRNRLARGTNADYWLSKIQYNMARDRRNTIALKRDGWFVVRLWEGAILTKPEQAVQKVEAALTASEKRHA